MNTDFDNNGHAGSVSDIQLSEQRTSEDRRDVDRRVCDRRELCAIEDGKPVESRRSSDRRDGERRAGEGARRSNDATPAPLGYELRLEARGPGGNRKASEITTTRNIPLEELQENCTATLDRLAREFHNEVVEHFRQNLPRVQLLRATVDCVNPPLDLTRFAAGETVEITLRAICLCRRKPDRARKSAAK